MLIPTSPNWAFQPGPSTHLCCLPGSCRHLIGGPWVGGKEGQLDPSSEGKEKECSTCRRHSQGQCLQLAWDYLQEQRPFCSRRPIPAAREIMGWSFQEAWASALSSSLGDDHRAVSSLWALCLTLGSLQRGDSGRCWEFLGLINTLNEF